MKERGILMCGSMVRATLDDRKTNTRRVVKPQPQGADYWTLHNEVQAFFPNSIDAKPSLLKCPYGVGDKLYVKETYTLTQFDKPVYRADSRDATGALWHSVAADPDGVKWKSSMFMPKRFARIWREVEEVRMQRVQDISAPDAEAEGVFYHIAEHSIDKIFRDERGAAALAYFQKLWDSINAKPKPVRNREKQIVSYVSYPWDDVQETKVYRGKPWQIMGNPWVYAISFRRITQ